MNPITSISCAHYGLDTEVVHTYEGTDNIQSILVGRDITGISAIV